MTDPRLTDPPPRRSGNTMMWGWIAGIAAVVLLAFILAASWNNDPQTAGNEPPATVGSGATTVPPSTADRGPAGNNATGSSTTGSGAADGGPTGTGSTDGAPTATPSPATPAPSTGGQ